MNPIPSSGDRTDTGKAAEIIRYFRHQRAGGCAYRMTASGAWAASRPEHLFYFFTKIRLSAFGLFIDLGSGDGIACFVAGLFTRSVGIESDPCLVSRAAAASRNLGLRDRVEFLCADFLTQHIQKADCLYIYPDKPMDALESALRGWKGVLLVYGPHFPPGRLFLREKLGRGRETMSVYTSD